MANFHTELDRIQAKYKADDKATAAIKELSKVFYELLTDFIDQARQQKNNSNPLS